MTRTPRPKRTPDPSPRDLADRGPAAADDSRGAATRLALIEAGLELFGQLGYHAASSRALAEAAGVNQALIGYHFGGKRGLYLAVFEHIGARMAERLGPAAASIEARLEAAGPTLDRATALDCLIEVTDHLVVILTSTETAPWAILIAREQQQPGDAFDILWHRLMGRVLRLLTTLVGTLRGRPTDDLDVRLQALTVMGQVLVFRMAAGTVGRHLGWNAIGSRERAAVQRALRHNLEALFSQEHGS